MIAATTHVNADFDALAQRSIGSRSIAVRRAASADELADCQLVFIAHGMLGNLSRVLDAVDGRPGLRVADRPDALNRGVMLNMDTQQGKVSFAANLVAARRQGLNLSAKLLRLATEVRQ